MLQRCALSCSFGRVFCCNKRSARCEELPGRLAAGYMAWVTRHQDIFLLAGCLAIFYFCYICVYVYIYMYIYICIYFYM